MTLRDGLRRLLERVRGKCVVGQNGIGLTVFLVKDRCTESVIK